MLNLTKKPQVKPSYPLEPELAERLEGLGRTPQWEAFLEWLDDQEESLEIRARASALKGVEVSALTNAACSEAKSQIGRIKTLPEVVRKVLQMYRGRLESKDKAKK